MMTRRLSTFFAQVIHEIFSRWRLLMPFFTVLPILLVGDLGGPKQVIFPEAGALGMIVCVLRYEEIGIQPWKLSVLPTLDALVGVAIARVQGIGLVGELIALAFVVLQLYLTQSRLFPLVSLTVLPVVFDITSLYYLASVAIISLFLALFSYLDRTSSTSTAKQGSIESTIPTQRSTPRQLSPVVYLSLFVTGATWMAIVTAHLPTYAMAPPLIVSSFEWLTDPRQHSMRGLKRRIISVTLATLLGDAAYLYAGHLAGTLIAVATITLVVYWVGDLHPPALAITLLPQLVGQHSLEEFAANILLGAIALYIFGYVILRLSTTAVHKLPVLGRDT